MVCRSQAQSRSFTLHTNSTLPTIQQGFSAKIGQLSKEDLTALATADKSIDFATLGTELLICFELFKELNWALLFR